MPDGKVCPEQFRGWLQKWTNYIKGYQKRWFVLSNGTLSYYRYVECIKSSVLGRLHTQLHIRVNPYCKGRLTFQGAFSCSSCILALFIAIHVWLWPFHRTEQNTWKTWNSYIYKSSLQCLKTTSCVSLDRT